MYPPMNPMGPMGPPMGLPFMAIPPPNLNPNLNPSLNITALNRSTLSGMSMIKPV